MSSTGYSSLLRFWKTIFEELSLRKNKAGNRTYREQDITLILKLKDLIQKKKYSTAGAQKILEQENSDKPVSQKSTELPAETRKDLNEIKVFLEKLKEKL